MNMKEFLGTNKEIRENLNKLWTTFNSNDVGKIEGTAHILDSVTREDKNY